MDNSKKKSLAFPAEKGLTKEIRVAVLFQRFGPYHHARLNAAGRLLSVWGVEACAMEDTYAWDKVEGAQTFTRITLTDRDSGDRRWRQELHRKMWQALEEIKPQVVVIPGWSFADALSALWWCVQSNVPAVVMSESTAWDDKRHAGKEWVKRRLIKLNSAGLAGGTPHRDYLVQLGLMREQVFLGYDVVDNEYFRCESGKARTDAASLRSRLGLPVKYFLASARFVEKKNLFRLIQAFGRYRVLAGKSGVGNPELENWSLVLLGDGPLKSDLQKFISELGLQASVQLPGFKQYDELPAYFGLASAFVHASTTEQWGLVVNEAMAAGLPVLVSNRCGCALDLVKDGVNGFTFDPGDTETLANLMFRLADGQFPIAEYGIASQRLVSTWGPERFATGLRDAVAVALKNPRPRAGIIDRLLLRLMLCR